MKFLENRRILYVFAICFVIFLTDCNEPSDSNQKSFFSFFSGKEIKWKVPEKALKIVKSAKNQIGRTIIYDPSYVVLKYPGGDVPIDRGVCTDVVIRALRDGLGMDLQKLVHEDMKRNFSKYPKKWGLKKPDSNIDHRRVPNLMRYFRRKGYSIAVTRNAKDYLPGDIVTCTVPPGLPHIMIVSDIVNANGVPFVIHNIGQGTLEEDRLFEFPLTGHYRIIR